MKSIGDQSTLISAIMSSCYCHDLLVTRLLSVRPVDLFQGNNFFAGLTFSWGWRIA